MHALMEVGQAGSIIMSAAQQQTTWAAYLVVDFLAAGFLKRPDHLKHR